MLSSFQTKMDIVNGILDAVFNNLPGADTADPSTGGTQVDVDVVDVELYLFQLDTEQDMELSEKEIEEHEAKILEIGKGFRAESSALAIVRLMEGIKSFLKRLTKEKAKVLMGKLVDLHLDILVSFTQDER